MKSRATTYETPRAELEKEKGKAGPGSALFLPVRSGGFTLIEILVVIAIIGILAVVLTGSVFNARKRTVDAAAESYARQVATWVAAADAGGADVTGVSECTDELLRQEGASAVFPNGVAGCSISYAGGHWTVAVNSQSGRVFQVSY